MKIKLIVTPTERTAIVAALIVYGYPLLAHIIGTSNSDPADDGPEIAILRDSASINRQLEGWDG